MRHDGDITNLNLPLRRSERDFLEAAATRYGCTTPSEYVGRLIHDAQRRAAHEELERAALAGIESGEPIPLTSDFWSSLRGELFDRHSHKHS